jgi:hypothetical protein
VQIWAKLLLKVREEMGELKLRLLLIGASQLGRMADEMKRQHSNKVNVVGCVSIEEEHTEQNMEKATINVEETQEKMGNVDVVLLVDLATAWSAMERKVEGIWTRTT